MDDDTLITAVREPFTGVHMNIPVEQIMSGGRAVRARRRIPGMAAAVAGAAGAALAVTALLPAGHQPGIRLAAGTVARQADGTVHVTIRQLRDPAGLQRQLRADGLQRHLLRPAEPSCRDYPATSPGLTRRVISPYQGTDQRQPRPAPGPGRSGDPDRPGASQPAVHRRLSRPSGA